MLYRYYYHINLNYNKPNPKKCKLIYIYYCMYFQYEMVRILTLFITLKITQNCKIHIYARAYLKILYKIYVIEIVKYPIF